MTNEERLKLMKDADTFVKMLKALRPDLKGGIDLLYWSNLVCNGIQIRLYRRDPGDGVLEIIPTHATYEAGRRMLTDFYDKAEEYAEKCKPFPEKSDRIERDSQSDRQIFQETYGRRGW